MHPTQKLQNASATQFCIKVHFLNHHITALHIMFGMILLLILFVTFLCQISFLCIEYPNLGSSQHSRHNSSAINCDWVYSEWAPNWLNFPMHFSKTSPVGALVHFSALVQRYALSVLRLESARCIFQSLHFHLVDTLQSSCIYKCIIGRLQYFHRYYTLSYDCCK